MPSKANRDKNKDLSFDLELAAGDDKDSSFEYIRRHACCAR